MSSWNLLFFSSPFNVTSASALNEFQLELIKLQNDDKLNAM